MGLQLRHLLNQHVCLYVPTYRDSPALELTSLIAQLEVQFSILGTQPVVFGEINIRAQPLDTSLEYSALMIMHGEEINACKGRIWHKFADLSGPRTLGHLRLTYKFLPAFGLQKRFEIL